MTWNQTVTIPAGETFDNDLVDLESVPEQYREDAEALLPLVDVLDHDDTSPRSVTLSGYRSGTTNNASVSVTARPNSA